MIKATKRDLIGEILTPQAVGCDVGEQRVSGTSGPYISYAYTVISPAFIVSGKAKKTYHAGAVDIYAVGASPEALRNKVENLLLENGVSVQRLEDGYSEEHRRWLLRLQFSFKTDNPTESECNEV